MLEIAIANEQNRVEISEEELRRAVETALRLGKVADAEISLALVDDATIHEINRTYLQHDYPTDVISFPLSESADLLEGEIVVSTDTAAREAEKIGGSWGVREEILLYFIHGTLHLVGFDDHQEADVAAMRQAEAEVLEAMGISLPRTTENG
ncbi:MAG: rRNA maturation RNase YbeY [Planctomycetia bacterium]|nr:rRNA maturation RNase YbeY [Planctomycetia bacterium]